MTMVVPSSFKFCNTPIIAMLVWLSNVGGVVLARSGNIHRTDRVRARGRTLQASGTVQKGGWPPPAAPLRRHKFSRIDLQRHTAHRLHFHFARLIGLMDVVKAD